MPPSASVSNHTGKPVPTILLTDIGNDIDDTWALGHLLRSPELDLKMVISETGDADFRSRVSAKFLEVAGRTDVAVAVGVDFGAVPDESHNQGPWVRNYQLENYPGAVHRDGVSAMIDLIRATDGPVNLIDIGPVPTLAEAVRRAPDIAPKCRLFGMHGSFDIGYSGSAPASAEYNVKADVTSFRTVLAADWISISLTPLDTCGRLTLSGTNYHSVWCGTEDPLIRAIIENYCIWAPRVSWMNADFFTSRTSPLFDDVAVLMAYSRKFLNYEEIRFTVTDDGFTRRDPDGPFTAQIAISWNDQAGFEDFLTQRLLGKSS